MREIRRDGLGDPRDPLGTMSNQIDVVVDTPPLQKMLAGVGGPPVVVNAWVKPVR